MNAFNTTQCFRNEAHMKQRTHKAPHVLDIPCFLWHVEARKRKAAAYFAQRRIADASVEETA